MDRLAAYNRLLALYAACVLLALAGFNLLIDPYGNFDMPRISGVNELSLGFNRRPVLSKAFAVSRIRPASVVLGNSRPESGYDPGYGGFEAPAYNLAVGGAGIGEARRLFLEALAAGRLTQVLLALDLTMFDPSLETTQRIPETFVLADDSGRIAGFDREWRRLAFALLSGTAVLDSWWSFRHQRDPEVRYLPSGLRDESVDERQIERRGGPRGISLRAESALLARTLRDVTSPGFHKSYDELLRELGEIIAISAQHGVRLDIVINPIHARYSYAYAAAGLWPAYEQWKRDLVVAVARPPRAAALWDFSGVSGCTSETMPQEGDATTKMRWFRESSHFRSRLGALVLDQVYGRVGADACPDLGRRLDARSLDATLASQRAALDHWITNHPDDVSEIDGLARRYGRGSYSGQGSAGSRRVKAP